MKDKRVTIFGGSGFIGREIARQLCKDGYIVNIVSRQPNFALDVKTAGAVGQVALSAGNIRDKNSIKKAIKGSDIVINLVGLLYEKGKQRFEKIHTEAAANIASSAAEEGVKKLIHLSALGIEKSSSKSKYAASKLKGEELVTKNFPDAVILRPSIVFGDKDNFFNQFAKLATLAPALPLIGGGKTKFQPVFVGDLAKAVSKIAGDNSIKGKIFEIAGPKVYSFKELLEYVRTETKRCTMLVPLPFFAAKAVGAAASLLPKPFLTVDQVRLLKFDNVLDGSKNNLESLGIKPTFLESVVPEYLAVYKRNKKVGH